MMGNYIGREGESQRMNFNKTCENFRNNMASIIKTNQKKEYEIARRIREDQIRAYQKNKEELIEQMQMKKLAS